MENIDKIKQLNAELARITKPKAYVQFYCDPDSSEVPSLLVSHGWSPEGGAI